MPNRAVDHLQYNIALDCEFAGDYTKNINRSKKKTLKIKNFLY